MSTSRPFGVSRAFLCMLLDGIDVWRHQLPPQARGEQPLEMSQLGRSTLDPPIEPGVDHGIRPAHRIGVLVPDER